MRPVKRLLASDKIRFLLAGASTTAFSYALYLPALLVLDPKLAYGLSYAAGIVWAYTVNTLWVFRAPWQWRGLLRYPLVYAVQAGLSFLIFYILVERLGLWPVIAPLITVMLTIPATYVLSRALIRPRAPAGRPPAGR